MTKKLPLKAAYVGKQKRIVIMIACYGGSLKMCIRKSKLSKRRVKSIFKELEISLDKTKTLSTHLYISEPNIEIPVQIIGDVLNQNKRRNKWPTISLYQKISNT